MVDASAVLRQGLLQLSRSGQVRNLIENAPVSRDVVRRFVAGESTADAVGAATALAADRPAQSPSTTSVRTPPTSTRPRATSDAYVELLGALSEAGLTQGGRAEVSVKLTAVGPVPPR